MKAIMYHYVREFDKKYPNFRFLDIKNFRKQLDYFEKKFGFLSKKDWEAFTNKGEINNKGKIILTFDDTLKCHFDYVFPELIKRDLWGIFYVPVSPYKTKKILDVHRIHLLCGAFNGIDLLKYLLELIDEKMIPDKRKNQFNIKTYSDKERIKEFDELIEFKRILNYFISYEHRQTVIDKISNKFKINYEKDFYVNTNNLKLMEQSGMIIGSHTFNHPVMSKLNRSDQLNEIKSSFNFLKEIDCIKNKTYCHPYGGFHSFNSDTLDLLKQENVLYSFNVESRDIKQEDIFNSPHVLPRYDCNEFPYGKAS